MIQSKLLRLLNLALLLACMVPNLAVATSRTSEVSVGLVLSHEGDNSAHQLEEHWLKMLEQQKSLTHQQKINLKLKTIQTTIENPIEMSQLACQRLLTPQQNSSHSSPLVGVLVETTKEGNAALVAALSFTLGLYKVPVLATNLRDSSLSNRNLHPSYLSLVAPYSHQADVWFALLRRMRFNRALVLSSSDGAGLVARLVQLADQRRPSGSDLRLDSIVEYRRAEFSHLEEAKSFLESRLEHLLETNICRVYLVHAETKEDVELFLTLIISLNMNSEGFAIILSEQTHRVAAKFNLKLPAGSIWTQLAETSSNNYLFDALELVFRGLGELDGEDLENLHQSCSQNPALSDHSASLQLYQSMLGQRFSGYTGEVSFDDQGHRLLATYDIYNLRQNSNLAHKIGTFRSNEEAEVDINAIEWPGGSSGRLISGLYVNRHLRVVSLLERPFVMTTDNDSCWSSQVRTNSLEAIQVPCLKDTKRLCCFGYCIDLLKELAERLGFTYQLKLVADNQYGREELATGAWSGLMGELVENRAEMAVAPLTITPRRMQAIDFSKPFKFHGFSILLRRAPRHAQLASFLQPFHNQLWVLVIGVATHVVALALYLLDRYSTLGRLGIKRGLISEGERHEDQPLYMSSSLWFSWSILLNSGVGENTPKSLSGRVLGIFWAGFAMIVVASYTANLAAFLVLDSREESQALAGIEDPRLRSGDLNLQLATVRGSAADAYLQSQVEFVNLYRKMEEFQLESVDEAIGALRAGHIDALIWDSARLEWEVASDPSCSLGLAGELFGSSGYGLGLARHSLWTANATTQLLELHESGFMAQLDQRWLGAGERQHCERRQEDKPETLGVYNIAGVFILFALGLVSSFLLIKAERLLYQHRARLLRRFRHSKAKNGAPG